VLGALGHVLHSLRATGAVAHVEDAFDPNTSGSRRCSSRLSPNREVPISLAIGRYEWPLNLRAGISIMQSRGSQLVNA
jgi:hypothetical protein